MRMKGIVKILLILVLVLTLSVGIVAFSFAISPNTDDENLPTNYEVDYFDGASRNDDDNNVNISFEEPTTFNTVVLKEEGDVIREFSFYYTDEEGKEHFIYKQDLVEEYRYCSFPTITTTNLRIEVKGLEDKEWNISDVEIYNMGGTYDKDFRVTAYVVSQYTYKKDSIDKDHFKAITHVNLISTVYFSAEGDIYFLDNYIDGVLVDGKKIFETSLANIREVAEEGTTIVATLLGQDRNGSGLDQIAIHESAFTKYKDNFIKNALEFREKYDLDGLSFDYEYPNTIQEYENMFETCRTLKEKMPAGSIMTIALGTWSLQKPFIFDKELMECVDWVESMNYDEMAEDPHDYHSTFSTSCYKFFKKIRSMNESFGDNSVTYTDLKDVNLGMPFYSRPLDGRGYWGDYKYVAESLGKYQNVKYDEYHNGELLPPTYYNSYQMIYDKVTYCIDQGFGGVMIWHYSCDVKWESELSLWHAIYDAVSSRK